MVDSKKINSRYAVVVAVLMLAVTSCSLGKKYHPPKLEAMDTGHQSWMMPDAGEMVVRVVEGDAGEGRWQALQDAQLSWLLSWAAYANHDLKSAAARIKEAEANLSAGQAALMPEINGTAAAAYRSLSPPLEDQTETVTQAGVEGRWDLDLFGGNRAQRDAVRANLESVRALQDQVMLDLTAEVARAYIQYRAAQHQKNLLLQNMNLQQETLKATLAQREAGMISDFEVTRGEAQVNTTASQLPQVEQTAAAAINRLSVLTTLSPQQLIGELAAIQAIPVMPAVSVVATPLDVIKKRPDIRSAEYQLMQTAFLRNSAFANYFPHISLESFWTFGHSSESGGFSPWGATLSGLLPILNFGAIEAQVNAADARQMQAYHRFQQSVLLALENLENALTAYLTEGQRHDILARVMQSQQQAAVIARAQYDAGTITQLDLLVSERNKLDAESAYVQSSAQVAENLVLLYRALGEQWQAQQTTTVIQ